MTCFLLPLSCLISQTVAQPVARSRYQKSSLLYRIALLSNGYRGANTSAQLACDARHTFPSACSRCTARRLDCKLDSSFKRVPSKTFVNQAHVPRFYQHFLIIFRRIGELTTELNDLRVAVGRSHSISSHQTTRLPKGSRTSSPNRLDGSTTARSQWLRINRSQTTHSSSLGRITLTAEIVLELLSQYAVEPSSAIPLLRWSTVSTSIIFLICQYLKKSNQLLLFSNRPHSCSGRSCSSPVNGIRV